MKNFFFNTNNQKVLRFLAENNNESKSASEIQSAIEISKGGLNFALRSLVRKGLVEKIVRAKTYFYQVKVEHPVIKQFKVLDSTIKIYPLIQKLSLCSQKIILFGSTARGEDLPDSDIDLLVVSHDKGKVNEILKTFKNFPLKPIIKTPLEIEQLKEKRPTFYSEIMRGITLFEKNE